MSLRKRKGSDVWHVDIRTPGGGRIRQTAGTTDKREAQEFHDKLKHEAWRSAKLGEKPKHTFDEAALRFLREHEETADYRTKVRHIRYWRAIFRGRNLETILRDEIMDALPQTVARGGQPKPTSASTRNRYLSTIRTMLKLAANQWEWINRVPQLAEAREPRVRIRWITREEAQRLLSAISEEWISEITAFGFATGLRQANILGLEWSQVDLAKRRAWIHPDQAKARKPIGVPLNSDAVAVLRRQIGKHATRVFVRDGKPIVRWSDFRWETACRRAGIENFRFHDVRHTWASWHVQAGTPLNRLMELGGWATYDMVLRYAHLAPDHLAVHADAVLLQLEASPVLSIVQ